MSFDQRPDHIPEYYSVSNRACPNCPGQLWSRLPVSGEIKSICDTCAAEFYRKAPGRPTVAKSAMTPAQRKARSRALLAGSIAGEAAYAKASIECAMTRDFNRTFGGTPEADFLVSALDAIARLEKLLASV